MNTLTIAKRQFRSYFNSPSAYIVTCLVLAFVGAMFWNYFFLMNRATVREMFLWMGRSMVFAAPAITMGLIAEEKRSGTIELLVTMPVKDSEVILGKYLGALGLFGVMVALTIVNPIVVSQLGNLDWGPVLSGYIGLILQGAAMIAVGVMTSSWTENQLIAFFTSFAILFSLVVLPMVVQMLVSGPMATVLDTLSLDENLTSMSRGVIDTKNVIYFLSLTIFPLMVAFRALESRRWS